MQIKNKVMARIAERSSDMQRVSMSAGYNSESLLDVIPTINALLKSRRDLARFMMLGQPSKDYEMAQSQYDDTENRIKLLLNMK